jgi:hypothetical protein
MKKYFKKTRHHLHAIVGLIGGALANLSMSLVWVGYGNLSSLDKAMWFIFPAFLIAYLWERMQGVISKSDIIVSGLFICLGIYLSDIIYNYFIN